MSHNQPLNVGKGEKSRECGDQILSSHSGRDWSSVAWGPEDQEIAVCVKGRIWGG